MMNKQIIYSILLFFIVFGNIIYSQDGKKAGKSGELSKLFQSQNVLSIKLEYSIKEIKKETNDSTFIKSILSYQEDGGAWKDMEIELRVRGNFRLKKCHFPPIKIKIKKSKGKGTIFEGNKKLKLVVPCLLEKSKNDNIIKEYMAYKLFESVSPYHFKTRLVSISFSHNKGKKTIEYQLMGFLIEDDKKVAKRYGGDIIERNMHPLGQDPLASVRNAMFQFMIGNLDYSTYVQHNQKLLYLNKKTIPLPYDFDISGLVNPSYAVIVSTNGEPLVNSMQERLYRGFKRDQNIINQVRSEFISNQKVQIDAIDNLKTYFEESNQFNRAKDYLLGFYKIMANDKLFKENITDALRSR